MIRNIMRIFVILPILVAVNNNCCAQTQREKLIESLSAIETELDEFKPDPTFQEDKIALEVTRQAFISIKEGSFGIGACIVDEKNGQVVISGHNELLLPYFRSDKHAEMAVLDKYEDMVKGTDPKTEGLMLYSSLEPCPMCTTRLLSANMKKVRYVSSDVDGGFVHHMDELPPYWKNQTFDKDYKELRCSPRLKELSHRLLDLSLELYGDRLK